MHFLKLNFLWKTNTHSPFPENRLQIAGRKWKNWKKVFMSRKKKIWCLLISYSTADLWISRYPGESHDVARNIVLNICICKKFFFFKDYNSLIVEKKDTHKMAMGKL